VAKRENGNGNGNGNVIGNPGSYSSVYYLQNTPLNLAVDLASWDPPFYTQMGGNLAIYIVDLNNSPSGFPTGPQELLERQDALKVAQAFTDNPSLLQNERANPQTPNPLINTGWPGNDIGDQDTTIEAWRTGSGVADAITAFMQAGYSQKAAANAIIKAAAQPGEPDVAGYEPCISLPSGIGSNYILGLILRCPNAWRWFDPVAFVDQTTGLIGPPVTGAGALPGQLAPPGTSMSAYHIGGGWVNLGVPGPIDPTAFQVGCSFLNWCWMIYFNGMGNAILAGVGVQGGPKETMSPKYAQAIALGKALDAFCLSAAKSYGISYTRADMLSSIPVTPAQKQWLAVSDLYDAFGIDPPTLCEAFLNTIMNGVVPPILPYTDPNAETVTSEDGNQTSQLGYNPAFWPTVLKIFSAQVGVWLNTDAGKLYPGAKATTLQLIANAYAGA
jgi:hypothetical protein